MNIDPQKLAQLNDIQLPDPIGWWPMAFAWWILLLSVFSILIGIIWHTVDTRRRHHYRRQAQQEITQIMRADTPAQQKIELINQVLKRTAITAYNRRDVAQLSAKSWLDFLKSKASYIEQPANLLDIYQLSFKPIASDDALQPLLETWQAYAQKWIKGHHQ